MAAKQKNNFLTEFESLATPKIIKKLANDIDEKLTESITKYMFKDIKIIIQLRLNLLNLKKSFLRILSNKYI